MSFDPQKYGSEVAAVLDLVGWRLMPLTGDACVSEEARRRINELPPSRAGAAAVSGLYLYCGCWAEAHEAAQEIETVEGSYWHAIVHRQEPDAFNSGYWFRRVGAHPIFPELRAAALEIGIEVGARWNPEAFIELCEKARQKPGSELERKAREVQRAEWQLLFDYCAQAS
jgi:hypothetical protein